MFVLFFFFKQKTAYEMRISDWSSDVCSSDLGFDDTVEAMYDYIIAASGLHATPDKTQVYCENSVAHFDWLVANGVHYAQKFSNEKEKIGRASCRERVCQYV